MPNAALDPVAKRIGAASTALYKKYGPVPEVLEMCTSLTEGLTALNAQPEMANAQVANPQDGEPPKN